MQKLNSLNTPRGSIFHICLRKHLHIDGLLFMRKINPIFLDGVARVGGRLAQLDIDVDIKHPNNYAAMFSFD